MFSARAVASVMPYGAYNPSAPVKIERPTRSPDPAAPAWQTDPWVQYIHNQIFNEHKFPLWNPYSGLGMPGLANMQSQPLFPPMWIPAACPMPALMDLFNLLRVLIGGTFCYLFLRLFLMRTASIIGGIAFMLTGYVILYLNMPEVSVAVTAPFVFYAFERVLRKPNRHSIVLIALSSALNLVAGMPELTALVMIFAGIYFLARLGMTRRANNRKLKSVGAAALGCTLGLCLAAPQVLPFLEYMRQSFNVHDPSLGVPITGTVTDGPAWWPAVLRYMLPYDLGGILLLAQEPLPAPVRSYCGIIVALFSFVAIAVLVRWRGEGPKQLSLILNLVLFFALSALFFVCKRFDCPLVNWVGTLPLFEMILFPKYDEPLLGLSLAVLAASGAHLLLRRRVKLVDLCIAILIISVPFGIWKYQEHPAHFLGRSFWLAYHYNLFHFAFFTAVSSAFAAAYMFVTKSPFAKQSKLSPRKAIATVIPWALISVLCLELTVAAIFPVFYFTKQLTTRDSNPYTGAPYISFLKENTKNFERVMGTDAFLFPCWSAAFGLYDIRALDAMYVGRFLPFVRNFLYGDSGIPRAPDDKNQLMMSDLNASTRFHGIEEGIVYPTELTPNSLLYKLLVLSSAKYVITEPDCQRYTTEMTELGKQNLVRNVDFFGLRNDFFTADGRRLVVVYQHPAGKNFDENKIDYKTSISKERPILQFRVGLTYRKPEPSDGARVYVHLIDKENTESLLFSKSLDNESGSNFPLSQLDLSKYCDKPVTLRFSVDAGPTKIPFYDWVGWADLRFVEHEGDNPAFWDGKNECGFNRIYDKECAIFENPVILPRASVFLNAILVSDKEVGLKLVNKPDFDVMKTVVVEDTAMTAESREAARALEGATGRPAIPQRITRYSSEEVEIEVDSPGGLLLLNDTMYVGWKAYIDGKEAPIHYANYLFRGVLVPSGKHSVVFKYVPMSFLIGIALFVVSAILCCAMWNFKRHHTKHVSKRDQVQTAA